MSALPARSHKTAAIQSFGPHSRSEIFRFATRALMIATLLAAANGLPLSSAQAEGRQSRSDLIYVPPPPTPVIAVEFVSAGKSEELGERLADAGMDLDAVKAGELAVPRLYTTTLPKDLRRLDSTAERKQIFIGALLPLVLMANEEILATREQVERLLAKQAAGEVLTLGERDWLNDTAAFYGTSPQRDEELLRRIDILPVSMTLAQAIEESGWGTSRYAREGNALFGQRTWSKNTPGLVARKDGQALEHRAQAFPDLMQSVRAYMHNVNTNPAYKKFRVERQRLRAAGEELDGAHMIAFLGRYAENAAYAENIRRLIRHNDLAIYEKATLASGTVAQSVITETAESVPEQEDSGS